MHRLPNPLEVSTRPPTEAEIKALTRTTAEIDRLLADTAKAWGVPTAQWKRIAAAMNRRNL